MMSISRRNQGDCNNDDKQNNQNECNNKRVIVSTVGSWLQTITQQQHIGSSNNDHKWVMLLVIIIFLSSLCLTHYVWQDTFYYKLRSNSPVLQRMHEHDSAIIRSIVYLRSTQFQNELLSIQQQSQSQPVDFCFGMTTRRRMVPYLHASIATLFISNTIEQLSQTSTIHIVDADVLRGTDEDDDCDSTGNYNNNHDSAASSTAASTIRRNNTNKNEKMINNDLEFIRQLQIPFVTIHDDLCKLKRRIGLQQYSNNTNVMIKKNQFNEDYATVLDICIETNSPYIIILEEDIIVGMSFLQKVYDYVIPSLVDSSTATSNKKIAFIKLFVGDKFDDYSIQEFPILIVCCYIIGYSIVSFALFWYNYINSNTYIYNRWRKRSILDAHQQNQNVITSTQQQQYHDDPFLSSRPTTIISNNCNAVTTSPPTTRSLTVSSMSDESVSISTRCSNRMSCWFSRSSVKYWIGSILLINMILIGGQNVRMLSNRIVFDQSYQNVRSKTKQSYRIVPIPLPQHEAGTLGIIYTRDGAIRARDYILQKRQPTSYTNYNPNTPYEPENADLLLTRSFLTDNNLQAYEVQPVLMQHMGVYSSIALMNGGDFARMRKNEGFMEPVIFP